MLRWRLTEEAFRLIGELKTQMRSELERAESEPCALRSGHERREGCAVVRRLQRHVRRLLLDGERPVRRVAPLEEAVRRDHAEPPAVAPPARVVSHANEAVVRPVASGRKLSPSAS